jgi:methyltransferase family protein
MKSGSRSDERLHRSSRAAHRPDASGWDSPRYKRLKPNPLGALEGEVIEIGPGSGVNLKYYRDNVHWTGVEPNTFLHERIRRRAAALGIATRPLAGSAERLDSPDESVDAVEGQWFSDVVQTEGWQQ